MLTKHDIFVIIIKNPRNTQNYQNYFNKNE